jgi:hypothetical protein
MLAPSPGDGTESARRCKYGWTYEEDVQFKSMLWSLLADLACTDAEALGTLECVTCHWLARLSAHNIIRNGPVVVRHHFLLPGFALDASTATATQ